MPRYAKSPTSIQFRHSPYSISSSSGALALSTRHGSSTSENTGSTNSTMATEESLSKNTPTNEVLGRMLRKAADIVGKVNPGGAPLIQDADVELRVATTAIENVAAIYDKRLDDAWDLIRIAHKEHVDLLVEAKAEVLQLPRDLVEHFRATDRVKQAEDLVAVAAGHADKYKNPGQVNCTVGPGTVLEFSYEERSSAMHLVADDSPYAEAGDKIHQTRSRPSFWDNSHPGNGDSVPRAPLFASDERRKKPKYPGERVPLGDLNDPGRLAELLRKIPNCGRKAKRNTHGLTQTVKQGLVIQLGNGETAARTKRFLSAREVEKDEFVFQWPDDQPNAMYYVIRCTCPSHVMAFCGQVFSNMPSSLHPLKDGLLKAHLHEVHEGGGLMYSDDIDQLLMQHGRLLVTPGSLDNKFKKPINREWISSSGECIWEQ